MVKTSVVFGLVCVLALLSIDARAQYETVIVESKLADGSTNTHPPYSEAGPWFNSTAKSTATGLVGSGSRYATTNYATFAITPTLNVTGGTYSVEVTQNGPASQSADILVSLSQSGCTGLPTNTVAFQQTNPNQWKSIGNLTLDPGVTQPQITFGYVSGTLNTSNGRFYSDSIRFIAQEQTIIESQLDASTPNTNSTSGYTELSGNWFTSANKATVSGVAGPKSRFASSTTNTPSFKVTPTLGIAGGVYAVEIAQTGISSESSNIVVNIGQSGCTGLPSSTTAFEKAGGNSWRSLGTIQLDPGVSTPQITFTYAGGAIDGANRFYFDAIRFLRLNIPPSFTLSPISQSVVAGSNVTLTATASGSPTLIYQWLRNGTNIASATRTSLTLSNVSTNDAGTYSVVAGNSYGLATSASATLNVLMAPTIVTQPQSEGVTPGGNVTFNVVANGNPSPGYQWRFNGNNIPAATNSSYSIVGVQTAQAGGYQVIVSNAIGSVTSQIALLSITSFSSVFSDDFETNSSSAWIINRSSVDTRVTFAYDYSLDGIPSAPNSTGGSTHGVKFEANMTNGVKAAISISPAGQQYSGDYQLHFDLWMNANGPFPSGGAGSSQHFTAGVATAGDRVQWIGTPSSSDGYWFAVDGEGDPPGGLTEPMQDFAAFHGSTVMTTNSGVYTAGTGAKSRDATDPYYAGTFPGGQTPPAYQQTHYPNQTGALAKGTIGFQWRDVMIRKQANTVEWTIDGLRVALFTNTTITASNIFVGYFDSFASLSDNPAMSFGVVDNLRVEQLVTNAPAFIAQQPHDQTAIAGSSVVFSVLAGGSAPLGYQWRFNGTNISGASSSSLVLPNAQPSDEGIYSVVVTNAGATVVSSNALLTVLVPVSIIAQPQNVTVDKGTPITFNVQATGSAPLSYQWQLNGTNIAGANGSTYSIGSALMPYVGNYSVVVSNAVNAVTSSNAFLKINGMPVIVSQPQRQTVPIGATATFSVSATGDAPLFYQWKVNGVALADDDRISGANTPTLTITGTLISDARNYSVTVSNWVGEVTSAPAILRLSSTQPIVMIESRLEGETNINTAPPYEEVSGTWLLSVLKSLAPDVTQSVGSRFCVDTNGAFKVIPALQANKSYVVQITHGIATSVSTDIVVGITQSNCFGLPPTTTAFDRTVGNQWETIGTITTLSNEPMPEITFYYVNGTTNGSLPNRFYADAVRFLDASQPCLFGLPQLPSVTGPLFAGQSFVQVSSVSSNAVKVTVYADGAVIGEKTNGITAGLNTIATSALQKGQQIVATQTDGNGLETCPVSNGSFVGGGANPRVRVSLSIRADTSLNGPIGANAGPASGMPLIMLGGTRPVDGFGTAPVGGRVIEPSECWQTVTFQRGADPTNSIDPTYAWFAGKGTNYLQGNYGVLDAIAFSIDDLSDTGPYEIYIDNLKNGDTVFQDFESYNVGALDILFKKPSYALTTYPFLISAHSATTAPNVSVVTSAYADTGNQSLFVNWQFGSTNSSSWLRLTAQGNGMAYPMVDLRQPISFRILLLPKGHSGSASSLDFVDQPISQTKNIGDQASFTVSATSSSPVTYQWRFNGNDITNATASTLTLSNLQPTNAGNYSVLLNNGKCQLVSTNATLKVVVPPTIVTQPQSETVRVNSDVVFSVVANDGGSSLVYQWQFNSTNLPGATKSSLLLTHVQPTNGGSYRVVVLNSAGQRVSDPAELLVKLNPTMFVTNTTSGPFHFSFSGEPGETAILEASTNLIDWVPRQTNTFGTTPLDFNDSTLPDTEHRFYRLRVP